MIKILTSALIISMLFSSCLKRDNPLDSNNTTVINNPNGNSNSNPRDTTKTQYIINASNSTTSMGSISPIGDNYVDSGGSITFTITPAYGCQVNVIEIDGYPINNVTSYTFNSVTKSHTIYVSFKHTVTSPNLTLDSIGGTQYFYHYASQINGTVYLKNPSGAAILGNVTMTVTSISPYVDTTWIMWNTMTLGVTAGKTEIEACEIGISFMYNNMPNGGTIIPILLTITSPSGTWVIPINITLI